MQPTGLVVAPDLVPGLMCLAPARLAECVAELQEAIRAVQPYEGKPFERKPVVVGSSREKTDIQRKLRAEARLAAKERSEGIGLAALERAGTDLVNLFRDLLAWSAARVGGAGSRRKAVRHETPAMLTPPKLAKRLGVSADKVRGWIKSGQLAATDVCNRPGGRPR